MKRPMGARLARPERGLHGLAPVLALLLGGADTFASALDARLKAFGTLARLPGSDLQAAESGRNSADGNLDLRLMWRGGSGNWELLVDHSTIALAGDNFEFGRSRQLSLDQTPTDDDRRALELTWTLERGNDYRLYHRFDRLAVQYRARDWGVTLGRQAVSWGSGKAFNPMDLFTPFAPTTVDRDYKPGEDLLIADRIFENGSDVQALAVFRRDEEGEREWDAGSYALKWHGFAGAGEVELALGKHYEDHVAAASLRFPLGGALLQTDWVATDLDEEGEWKFSAVVNIDYSFSLAQKTAYIYGEYYRNGFGRDDNPIQLQDLPDYLVERLQRGEVFTLMKDYLAVGGSYQWHPLWLQSLTVLYNLHDDSSLWQSSISFEPDDHQRLEAGVTLTGGSRGEEFGRIEVGEGFTTGGGERVYLRWAYYW